MLKSLSDYNELATLTDVAEECLGTLRYGSHYELAKLLREKYGIVTRDAKLSIKAARRLCDEFITAYDAN
jgi:hypothetical protein